MATNTTKEPPTEDNGRTVVIRGPEGEVIISSSHKKDSIKDLADQARLQYEQQKIKKGMSKLNYVG